MPEMSKTEIDTFLGLPLLARIATVRPDGRPHIAPMWFWWDGSSMYMETGPDFVKTRNLRANPRAAVSVDLTEGGLRFKGVIMEGTVELIDDRPFVLETCTRIYTRYLGAEGARSPTPQQMIGNEHVIIRLSPRRVTSWDDTRTALAPIP